MATDQLETDLRELLAGQAGDVSTDRLAKITTRNYHPRTHSTLTPLALGAGVAAVATVASVAATSGSTSHRVAPSAKAPAVIHVTTAARHSGTVHAATTGHTTLTLDGYRVNLPTKAASSTPGDYWWVWAPDCSGGKSTNTDCPAVAIVSLGVSPDNATKHEATAPDGTKVTWYVSTAGGNTTTYFPVALPNGTTKDIGLQLADNGTMSDADAIAFAQGINVVG